MVNALRPIEPGAIFPLKIEFCPEDSKEVRFITFLRFYFAHLVRTQGNRGSQFFTRCCAHTKWKFFLI